METRANAKVEIRTNQAGQKTLVGYASTFDHPYPVDMVTEIIDRKAFTRTLQEKPDVYALVGHDPARVIGRTKNGTLSLTVDERGLRCEIVPVDTQEARDVVALVESGTLDAMSFGFKVKDQRFEYRDGGVHRRIMDCELHEVSVVAFPANPDAKLSMRDRAEVRSLLRKHSESPKTPKAKPCERSRLPVEFPSLLSEIAAYGLETRSWGSKAIHAEKMQENIGGEDKTLYRFRGKHYIVWYIADMNETHVYEANAAGVRINKGDGELWSERGKISHDEMLRDFLTWRFKLKKRLEIES